MFKGFKTVSKKEAILNLRYLPENYSPFNDMDMLTITLK